MSTQQNADDCSMDPSEAYFYDVLGKAKDGARSEEIRRAYALHLVVERIPEVRPDKIVEHANDLYAFLKDGKVPGKGVERAVDITWRTGAGPAAEAAGK